MTQHRMTQQRRIILDKLRQTKSHPSADELYLMVRQVLPHISLGTVYRNLEMLQKMGLITKIELGGNQKRFDGNTVEHYHINCIVCKRIDDIPLRAVKKIEYSTEEIDYSNIIGHSLNFYGVCKNCGPGMKKNN